LRLVLGLRLGLKLPENRVPAEEGHWKGRVLTDKEQQIRLNKIARVGKYLFSI
jgi:hypothetical protein